MREVARPLQIKVVTAAIVGALLTTPFVARSMMADDETTTPFKHLVVVFHENVYVDLYFSFFFQAEDGIRDFHVTGVQTCALPISSATASTTSTACSRATCC